MWRCRGCILNVLRRLNLSKSAFWVGGAARPGGSGRHSSASRPVSVSLRTIVSAWRDCPPPARRGSRRTMALWVAVSRETRRKMGDSRSLIEGSFAGGVRGSATLSGPPEGSRQARPTMWLRRHAQGRLSSAACGLSGWLAGGLLGGGVAAQWRDVGRVSTSSTNDGDDVLRETHRERVVFHVKHGTYCRLVEAARARAA